MNEEKTPLGYDEIADSIADVLETADTLSAALRDGFQITDVGALLSVAPKAQEIARDYRVAIEQLLDLTADETDKVTAIVAARTGKSPSIIVQKANEGFTLIARTYRTIQNGFYLAKDWERYAKSFAA